MESAFPPPVPPAPTEGTSAEAPTEGEAHCPRCNAPPSPGRWCMACGAAFDAAPRDGSLPPGGTIAAKKFACGGCGALMLWDADTRGLKCPFCGGTTGVERDEDYLAVENALEDVPKERLRADAPKVFTCDRCGSSVRFEGTTVSASCAFCGSEHVVERTGAAGRILPASALPFQVGREAARGKWREWLGRGLFRPRRLRESASGEALKGIYLPFWTYDTRAWSRWTADAGHHYWVTVRVGNQTQRQMRTRWVPASGQRKDVYDDVLVCASRGVEERLLERTYPYGLSACQPYRSEFLSGWAAEEYAVDLKEGWERARKKVNEEEVRRCSREVPGDTQRNLRVWTQHAGVTWKHLLLPLWIATYRFRGKTYRFLVNGQTGKVSGTAPVSWVKVTIAVLLAAAVGIGIWLLARG